MRKTEGSPLPFGAAAKERKVNFSVQVPMGKTCELLLYREGNTKPEVCFDMPEEEGIGEVRFLSVEEIDPEKGRSGKSGRCADRTEHRTVCRILRV